MRKTNFLILILILLLASATFVFGTKCLLYRSELSQARENAVTQQINQKGLSFARLIVDKILLGDGEVSFDDRLKLENAVRDLNDPEIFSQWQKFVNSKSSAETQQSIGVLFNLLLKKILL